MIEGSNGQPIVSWTETAGDGSTDIRVAQYDPSANGGAGGWVALGTSLTEDGVSATGHAVESHLVATSTGPVVVWTDDSSGRVQVYARIFSGGTWNALGGDSAVTGDGISDNVDVRDLAVATDGTRVAVAWTAYEVNTSSRQVYLKEFTEGAWTGRFATATGTGVSGSFASVYDGVGAYHAQPTLAYFEGDLFVAWQAFSDEGAAIMVTKYEGSSAPEWRNYYNASERPAHPQLASNGGKITLAWIRTPLEEGPTDLYARTWNGFDFVETVIGEAQAPGISTTGEKAQGLSLALDATGRPVVAWQEAASGSPEIFVRANLMSIGTVYRADESYGITVQDILEDYDLNPGDVIVVSGTHGGFDVNSEDAGVIIIGTRDAVITGDVFIDDGAANVTLQRLTIQGRLFVDADGFTLTESTVQDSVVLISGDGNQIVYSAITGDMAVIIESSQVTNLLIRYCSINIAGNGLTIYGGSGLTIRDNVIHGSGATNRGLLVAGNASGYIGANDIGTNDATRIAVGLDILFAFDGLIEGNDIHGAVVGVNYAVAADLSGNRIRNNSTGITSSISGTTQALGFVSASSKPNEIYANGTGVSLANGRMQNQHVYANNTGVTGSGIIGGESLDLANVIEGNTTGVGSFTGTIQFNRFSANATAINAFSEQRILNNLFYRNTSYGVLVSGRNDVRIFNNTFYAPTGDNVRIQSSSSEVEVQNNIMWAMTGYDIYVANDSRAGFFSDYNDLSPRARAKWDFIPRTFTTS